MKHEAGFIGSMKEGFRAASLQILIPHSVTGFVQNALRSTRWNQPETAAAPSCYCDARPGNQPQVLE
jgi:hypothetical protein